MADFSILGFVEKLAAITVETEHATHDALEEAATLIERESKAAIGEYQPEAGPFEAWRELAQSTQDQRVALGYSANEPLLREGTLRDSIEHTVQGHEAHIGSNLDIAEYQELGTSKIPPRSFLGSTAFRESHHVAEICGSHMIGALTGQAVPGGRLQIPLGAGELGPEEGAE